MKATLEIKGEKVPVEITGEKLDKVLKMLEKPVKKTGYERVNKGELYYSMNNCGFVDSLEDTNCEYDDTIFDNGNYYSDEAVAENNARADTLMRKLRRFAVEHREKELDWNNQRQTKYSICYYDETESLEIMKDRNIRNFGGIYFDTKETAQAAIEEFKDELIWYFTEYKDCL